MRKALLPFLLLLTAVSLSAAQPERAWYPDDYKKPECAPPATCKTFPRSLFSAAARKFIYRELDPDWAESHFDQLAAVVKPYCEKRAACLGSNGRQIWYCNDIFMMQLRAACDTGMPVKKDGERTDHDQCVTFMDTWAMGVDQSKPEKDAWETAQACAAKDTTLRTMEWWFKPAVIPPGYKDDIYIYAIDSVTHVPVPAELTFENQPVYTTHVPSGMPTAPYPFKWPRKLVRQANAQGHTDVRPPTITLQAPGYQTVVAPFPTSVGAMKVSVSQPIEQLRRGRHTITVTATDADTGKLVEAQVMAGEKVIGFTNKPIELEIPRGPRAEIWVTSPFNEYSDVVIGK